MMAKGLNAYDTHAMYAFCVCTLNSNMDQHLDLATHTRPTDTLRLLLFL